MIVRLRLGLLSTMLLPQNVEPRCIDPNFSMRDSFIQEVTTRLSLCNKVFTLFTLPVKGCTYELTGVASAPSRRPSSPDPERSAYGATNHEATLDTRTIVYRWVATALSAA